eukprot:6535750-Pyramimonas_sp.AAC.1
MAVWKDGTRAGVPGLTWGKLAEKQKGTKPKRKAGGAGPTSHIWSQRMHNDGPLVFLTEYTGKEERFLALWTKEEGQKRPSMLVHLGPIRGSMDKNAAIEMLKRLGK